MIWMYLGATIFGLVFLIPMLLGGLDSDVGGDVELEGDLDLDVDSDFDLDVGDTGALGAVIDGLLSFRSIVFFSAFFGTAGLVFTAFDYSAVATVLSALLIGGGAALINSALYGFLKNSDVGSDMSNRRFEGRQATVVLPIEANRRGRVRIDLDGQPQQMVARPFKAGSRQEYGVGESVVVVEIENGTALVTSLSELGFGEES